MAACRMDLADVGSPEAIIKLILAAEPELPLPVPIEELCHKLDITAIQDLKTDGFEGGLITDTDRSEGIILVKNGLETRRRFTIAHELGHFLMPSHVPDQPGRFLCKSSDLHRLAAKEGDRRQRMEFEANRFASLLLMPPPMIRQAMRDFREPDLQHIPPLARQFNVSREAMARAYAQYHGEPVAIIMTHNSTILRNYRNIAFPFIVCANNSPVPAGSLYHRGPHELSIASDFAACIPDHWIEVRRGERAPTLYEQVYPQRDGYGLLLLHLERANEREEEEDRAFQEQWHVGFRQKKRRS